MKAEDYGCSNWDIGKLDQDDYFGRIAEMMGNLSRLIKQSDYDSRTFYPIILKVGSGRRGDGGIVDMDYEFQRIAKEHKLVLWDKVFNKVRKCLGKLECCQKLQAWICAKELQTNLCWKRFVSTKYRFNHIIVI